MEKRDSLLLVLLFYTNKKLFNILMNLFIKTYVFSSFGSDHNHTFKPPQAVSVLFY